MQGNTAQHDNGTVDANEAAKFAAIAAEWWDPNGKFRPLHRFNPTRLEFIRARACNHFVRDPARLDALAGLKVLDIGCGGGLIAEPMARMGAEVTGIDVTARSIAVARHHAEAQGVDVTYREATAEALAEEGARFDLVLTLEVVEHVADVDLFLHAAGSLVAPGGMLIAATLNRTKRAFAFAIVGAEYVLGWLPRGTHDWRKFVKPSEMARGLRTAGLSPVEVTGVVYNPLSGEWRLNPRDVAVNYMMVATRPV